MTKFLDGPARGVSLWLKRAPLFLRVVLSKSNGDKFDALDKLDDKPEPDEHVYCYVLEGTTGSVHLDRTVNRRRVGEWYQYGEYLCYPNPPTDDVMRDNDAWAAWVQGEAPKADAERRKRIEAAKRAEA